MKNKLFTYKNWLFAIVLIALFVVSSLCARAILADTSSKKNQTEANDNVSTTSSTAEEETSETADDTSEVAKDTSTVLEETDAEASEEAKDVSIEDEVTIGYSTAEDLNIRKKRSIYSTSLKKLKAGESMTILSEKGNWYKVTSGDVTGYVNKLYVSTAWIAFSNTVNLNLRKKPSKTSKVLNQLNQGDSMTVLKKSGKWYKVSYEDTFGYVKGNYIDFQCNVYVAGNNINMRKSPHTESGIIRTLSANKTVTLLEQAGDWYRVRYNKKTGYIHSDYLSFTKVDIVPSSSRSSTPSSSSGSDSDASSGSYNTSLGQSIVSYAKQFLGNPYVYGGTSLTNGADCSGFVQSVYAHFGIYLPRTSEAQRSVGYSVGSLSNAKPGDIICYYGHVGIYIGNNAIIHASNEKTGIKITYNAAYRSIASIRRVF